MQATKKETGSGRRGTAMKHRTRMLRTKSTRMSSHIPPQMSITTIGTKTIAVGPIGLLVESVVWHGMNIDAQLRIWQRKEEPISILKVPYQNSKPLILNAAGRSRNRAEWHRGVSSKRGRAPLEIDNEVSQVVATFEEEEKGILRVVQMGGAQALNEIADYNQAVGRICNYCMETISTSDTLNGNANILTPRGRRSMPNLRTYRTNSYQAASKMG